MGGLSVLELVRDEIVQRKQEGCEVPDYKIENAGETELERIYDELITLRVKPDFPFSEPEELCDILSESDGCTYEKIPQPDTLYDRFYGAWLGRTIGCIIGKPLECHPYGGDKNADGWEHIRRWQSGTGTDFPPVDYISGTSTAEKEFGLNVSCEKSQKENIRFAESDDDIRYLVLGLLVNERYGNDFTPCDIADMWHKYLTPSMVFTAERAAMVNSLICTEKDGKKQAEFCRMNRNPYREWIGAQIRIDHYAYYNAGNPLEAAKTAYNDASFSHTKNGVYGAMFFAALIAAAFTESDIERCIDTALTVVPKKSRLYADILFAVETAKESTDAVEIYKKLWNRFRGLSAVHTNNNAAVCVAALIAGKGDYVKSVSIAVGAGWDTDCNGATVGSAVGALNGAAGIPEYLKVPLNDTIYSSVPDFHPVKISECAERTYKAFLGKKQITAEHGKMKKVSPEKTQPVKTG